MKSARWSFCTALSLCLLLLACIVARAQSEDRTFPLLRVLTTDAPSKAFERLSFSSDGTLLATLVGANPDGDSEGEEQSVVVWKTADGKALCTIRPPGGQASGVAFRPGGPTLIIVSMDAVRYYDGRTGALRKVRSGAFGKVPPRFSRNGAVLACASSDEKTVLLMDVLTGRPPARLAGRGGTLTALAFDEDSTRLFSAYRHEVKGNSGYGTGELLCWKVKTRKLLSSARTDAEIMGLGFASGLKLLVAGGVGGITLWDAERCIRKREIGGGVIVALSAARGGRYVAAVPVMEPYAEVFDLKEGTLAGRTRRFHGHGGDVAFSPDGKVLAAALGSDVALYDVTRSIPPGPDDY